MSLEEYQTKVEKFMKNFESGILLRPIDTMLERNRMIEKGVFSFRECNNSQDSHEFLEVLFKLKTNPILLRDLAEEGYYKYSTKQPGLA